MVRDAVKVVLPWGNLFLTKGILHAALTINRYVRTRVSDCPEVSDVLVQDCTRIGANSAYLQQ